MLRRGFLSGRVLKCHPFADDLVKGAMQAGIKGERLFVTTTQKEGIISSARLGWAEVSRTGIHEGIRIGDTVFDSISPYGIPYDQWIRDFGVARGASLDFLPPAPF